MSTDCCSSRREALAQARTARGGRGGRECADRRVQREQENTSEAPATSTARRRRASQPATATAPPPGSEKALPTEPITWPGPQGDLQAAWAEAPDARGGVLVIHENKGLNDWVRSVAGRFAGIGYSALAIDLLSAQGGTAKFADPAAATAALGAIPNEEFVANLRSGVGELQRRVPDKKIAAVGFCMGGGLVWRLRPLAHPSWRPPCRSTDRPPTIRISRLQDRCGAWLLRRTR